MSPIYKKYISKSRRETAARKKLAERPQPADGIPCAGCGEIFIRKSYNGKYCNLRCKARTKYWKNKGQAWRPKQSKRSITKPCEVCGKGMYVSFAQMAKYSRRTCSHECMKEWIKRNPDRRLKNRGKQCKQCGGELTNRCFGKKFCSWTCFQAMNKSREIEKECLGCGATFKRNTRYFTERAKYCSKRCQLKYSRGLLYPGYRGKREGDRGPGWSVISQDVRLRDNFTCQGNGCSVTQLLIGKKIPVDHIVPYRLAKEIGNANDHINLACLCLSCHSKKTPRETKILRGDVTGFINATRHVYADPGVILRALVHYGLLTNEASTRLGQPFQREKVDAGEREAAV